MIHDGEVGFSRSGPPFVSSVVAERVPTSQHAIMSSAMLGAKRARMNDHLIEEVGEKLRGMMHWAQNDRLVDKSRN